ncbi:oxidoreductase [Arthrobacter sp. SRS-W-1-2016]|uniref:aldo/keto reductase n=1 Tax=Arthrobacter sp. SRS-W-1-2016 TaxID=1930254 RepID=UPI000990C3BF|nr:aldo/keto reductase [Arthrobacter sp. SRS-W-1-2016]OOP60491.1 oxidoreductase [Arthrobacter sp. SRS-W-1-2016]
MEYAHLGRAGLVVSRLALGTLGFGPEIDQANAHALMDRAHEHGINLIDTSNVYGHKHGGDWAEEVIGRWFAKGGGRRDKTVLATKVFEPQSDWPNDGRLSALHIRKACDASLARLQTDHIDIYQMHHIDRNTPWDEIWEAMEVLRNQGKILYVGSSNFAGWHIAQAQAAAKERHFLGLVSEQSIYNLMTRDIERELLPAARECGVGILAWSPLNRGMLGGMIERERNGTLPANFNGTSVTGPTRGNIALLNEYRSRLERYEDLCANIGAKPAQVAVAWLLSRPGITSSIVGPVNQDQLDDTVGSLDLELEEKILSELDDIFPGYLPAPEDYAW